MDFILVAQPTGPLGFVTVVPMACPTVQRALRLDGSSGTGFGM